MIVTKTSFSVGLVAIHPLELYVVLNDLHTRSIDY